MTGRFLPTGNPVDTLNVPGIGSVEVTIIDAANPVVLVAADQVGLSGTEIEAIEKNRETKDRLEAIRCAAVVVTGETLQAPASNCFWPISVRKPFS